MNPNVQSAYGKQKLESWNRIDMLLALYDSGINALAGAIEAEQSNDSAMADRLRMKALRVIQGLVAGLDLNQGEVPNQMLRLFEYSHHSIHTRQPNHLQDVKQLLLSLRDGFAAIRAEAVALERGGEVPSLESTRFEMTV